MGKQFATKTPDVEVVADQGESRPAQIGRLRGIRR
jgi:hypothetical protein